MGFLLMPIKIYSFIDFVYNTKKTKAHNFIKF